MGFSILLVAIIGIVCGNQGNPVFAGKGDQGLIGPVFVLLSVPHDFHIEILTKFILPPKQGFFRLLFALVQHF